MPIPIDGCAELVVYCKGNLSVCRRVASKISTSMSGIDHVLLTRFNLPSTGFERIVRAQEGWLRSRVELFERYCLPSVAAQTNKNFRWIIYFDPESPDWLKSKIDTYTRGGAFKALFRSEVSRAELISDIQQSLGESHEELLTSNLDNDDGLAADFIERLQRVPRPAERSAVYFVNGLIKSRAGLFWRIDKRNAFCSVRETWRDPKACWSEWHNLLGTTMPVIELTGAPAWLQVIHGSNVSNRIKGRLTAADPYRGTFPGLLDDVAKPSRLELIHDRFVGHPFRRGRESVRAAIKAIAIKTLGKEGMDRARLLLASRRRGRRGRKLPDT